VNDDVRTRTARAIDDAGGILTLDAALVARDWIVGGRRIGLAESEYDVGKRGMISERWLASTTHADNAYGPEDEGISSIRTASGERINLKSAVEHAPECILGDAYAAEHSGLGRLAKIYDFNSRIPFHIHPPLDQAQRVGRNSKDEACYFPPGVPLGPHPESFLGLHPSLTQETMSDYFLDEWRRWDSDHVLSYSRAYLNVAEGGFYIPSGVLHAPGTALTIELQEDSDTLAMLQGVNDGRPVTKDLLFKDVSEADRATLGERALLEWIDWQENLDPYFYENHRIEPRVLSSSDCHEEAWILYGSRKFSGKRLLLRPGGHYESTERGVFNLLVWSGSGTIGGVPVVGGKPDNDELLIVHDRAIAPIEYVNDSDEDMIVIKFFGPDINPDSPVIERMALEAGERSRK
jgi:hypothetical protein